MDHHGQTKNHDKHHDESKTRTHRLSKLPDDGDPWAPNNLLTPEQKKYTSWTLVGQATDKKLRSQPIKMIMCDMCLSHNVNKRFKGQLKHILIIIKHAYLIFVHKSCLCSFNHPV